jgi:type VI secretion system secreted protein VgrG
MSNTGDPRVLNYRLSVGKLSAQDLRLLSFVGTEALPGSCLFEIEVAGPVVAADDLLGQEGTLEIFSERDQAVERTFHGVVLDAAVYQLDDDTAAYQLRLGSLFDSLSIGQNTRMFQEMSAKEIISDVLDKAGLAGKYSWSCDDPPKRLYEVQYHESDYELIMRLLQDEGINVVVRNEETAAKLFFFDATATLPLMARGEVLYHRDSTRLSEDVAFDLTESASATFDSVFLRDYDPRQPTGNLDAPAGSGARELYVYPGGYSDQGVGKRRAARLLQQLQVGKRVIRGRSDCCRLEPAVRFSVLGTPRSDGWGELVALSVTHRGQAAADDQGAEYVCELVAIPKTTPLAPARARPEPCLTGTQVAFVTCPPGEEIHTDDYGRVKVRFPWDLSKTKDDKSSTWLRVGQQQLGGAMILPRHDFEVLVDFEEGDLDRPSVIGHLYNEDYKPPYPLPGGAVVSSLQTATTAKGPGANEWRLDAAAGNEEMYLHASKDMNVSVGNDHSFKVGNDEKIKIDNNHTLHVHGDRFANVTGKRTLTVTGEQKVTVGGDYSDGVGGNLTTKIAAMRNVKVGGDMAEDVKGTLTRTVGFMQAIMGIAGYARKIVGNSTVLVSGLWTEMAGKARSVKVGGAFSETVGALKLFKGKKMAISVGAAYSMQAGVSKITCDGSRTDTAKGALTVTAAGALEVKAKTITFSGKNKIVVRAGGTTIELTKTGDVKIKSSNVSVKGVKALTQIMHKSNG